MAWYVCDRWAESHQRDNPALIYDDRKISWRELGDSVNRVGNALLELGVKRGDRVLLRSPNCPEQCYAGKLDPRSDLYSLGCTMYEAFSGKRMFDGSSIVEVMMKHVNDQPELEPLQEARVSKKVTNLIMKLLQKSPNDRPASASEVRDKLRKS